MRIFFMLAGFLATASAQSPPAAAAARKWRQAHEVSIVREFVELLAIPNVASDRTNIARNAALISRMLEQRGVQTRLLEVPGAPPVVFGELKTPGAKKTLVFYAHYDGQPVEPGEWASKDPFRPVLHTAAGEAVDIPTATRFDPEWRIYARSASDDKAPVIALTSALDALRAANVPLESNIKFFFEGEEEASSAHLEQIITANKDLLSGDLWIFCDGPVHQNGRQQIVFGARGVTGFGITVYGPRHELHSGHYGNWAPNPAMMLAQLLASMKDAEGRVLVKGFYDGIAPLTDTEKEALAAMPNIDAQLKEEFWLGRTEGGGMRLDELLQLPALNVRGFRSGAVGTQSRNVIPAEATASMEIRLVKGLDGRAQVQKVIEHIKEQGYFVTDKEPDAALRQKYGRIARVTLGGGYNAVRTSMDLEISQLLIRAVEQARGPVIKMPTSGGSLPMTFFDQILKLPMIVVPIVNHDNNQHSHNENLRLQNLWDGIETMAALLAM